MCPRDIGRRQSTLITNQNLPSRHLRGLHTWQAMPDGLKTVVGVVIQMMPPLLEQLSCTDIINMRMLTTPRVWAERLVIYRRPAVWLTQCLRCKQLKYIGHKVGNGEMCSKESLKKYRMYVRQKISIRCESTLGTWGFLSWTFFHVLLKLFYHTHIWPGRPT